MLEPATTYQYSVIAKDDDGNRSIPSSIELTTLEKPPLPPIINRSNHVELLRHVFDIYTGNAYVQEVVTLPDWSDPAYSGVSGPRPPDWIPEPGPWETTITCINGGTARFVWDLSIGWVGGHGSLDFYFDNCQDDDALLDGDLRRYEGRNRATLITISSDGFSSDTQSRQVRFSGRISDNDSSGYFLYRSRDASDVNYSQSDGQSELALSDVNTRVYKSFNEDLIGGDFTFRSTATGNRAIRVQGELSNDWGLDSEPAGNTAGAPPAPQNLEVHFYSSTAAELIWDQPLPEDAVINTQVWRNCELLGETDDTSFFDNTRVPGEDYRYFLVAVNASGQASSPTHEYGEPVCHFEFGSLELSAEDGSGLILNASNSDPLFNVTIEIRTPDGRSDTLTQPWTLWAKHFYFDSLRW